MDSPRPYYHEFAWAYDLLQPEPVVSRIDFIQATLTRLGITVDAAVLDAGCGTGRYAVELAKRGYRVSGVDRSPELIAVAQNRYQDAWNRVQFVIADLLEVSFPQPFDAVLCRGVLNDFVEAADRSSVFQRFALWLRPGGILIFDVRELSRTFARYAETSASVHRRTIELPNGSLRFQSNTVLDAELRALRIHERFDMHRGEEQISTENDFVMRCWTLDEINDCLLAAGLQEIGRYLTYGEDDRSWSDRLVVAARKLSETAITTLDEGKY
jgi:2-polyprenyl-3-methyl-5-hydroxy-6-metoxy-1,4-benzoquinol methylase